MATKTDEIRFSKKLKFANKDLKVADLLLDPNNYRFLDNPNYKRKIAKKFHEEKVQDATLHLLEADRKYQLSELKKSIMANGFVPMERIIVVPYKFESGKYLVVEGNRRVAALKSLLNENALSVINLSKSEITNFSTIPCAILNASDAEVKHAERVIMGIRHVAGTKEWGAYQQAQLIVELHSYEGYDFKAIGEHLGISTMEVARRYRAMTALHAMESDELYAEKAQAQFYRLFHELVALPDVRARFGWDSEESRFTDIEAAREFFELIAPAEDGVDAKLQTYSDVRKLKQIVGVPKAEAILLDPDKSLVDALEVAEEEQPAQAGATKQMGKILDEVIAKLSSVGFFDVLDIGIAEREKLDQVASLIETLKAQAPPEQE